MAYIYFEIKRIFCRLKPGWMRGTGEWSARPLQTNPSGIVCAQERDLVKVWGSYLAINNIFPQASRLTPSALSRSYLAGLKLRETQCWAEITLASQRGPCAAHHCIKLGLTSPFLPLSLTTFLWHPHPRLFLKNRKNTQSKRESSSLI